MTESYLYAPKPFMPAIGIRLTGPFERARHEIVRMRFGSHLYGTDTPQSDIDIKAVHIPASRDILLQRAQPVIHRSTKTDRTAKNAAGDEDFESYSLQKYLHLVAEGQTVALDMLFAPDWALTATGPLWREIKANRHRLLSRQYASFLGYCRAQANKYGIKGSRMAAARAAVEFLDRMVETNGTTAKLDVAADAVARWADRREHVSIEDIDAPGSRTVRHLVVCNRKMPYTATIKNAHGIMKALFDEYGQRVLAAERNEGVDWKALSHAVRIGRQAVELLKTGFVTFPRPERDHLRAIKAGLRPYAAVADEIERLLANVEQAAAMSSLPLEPDRTWIDDFVADAYRERVRHG